MPTYLNLRSGNSGVPFLGTNEDDTLLFSVANGAWYVGPGGGGGGAVASVFGRTGVVVAATGDYDGDQVDNVSGVPGASISDALDYLEANAGAVASVFGRTGAVTAQPGDYADNQVTNGSSWAGASVRAALNTIAAGDFGAATLQTTGPLAIGATPRSGTGGMRVGSSFACKARNAGNTVDVNVIDFGITEADAATMGDSTTLVQSKFIASARNVVGLCRTTGALTATQMPAGSGDGIEAVEDCLAAPTVGPAAGRVARYVQNGFQRWRSPDNTIISQGGE